MAFPAPPDYHCTLEVPATEQRFPRQTLWLNYKILGNVFMNEVRWCFFFLAMACGLLVLVPRTLNMGPSSENEEF